jgi:hypothetical protein
LAPSELPSNHTTVIALYDLYIVLLPIAVVSVLCHILIHISQFITNNMRLGSEVPC